jgi:hypothetical protein
MYNTFFIKRRKVLHDTILREIPKYSFTGYTTNEEETT